MRWLVIGLLGMALSGCGLLQKSLKEPTITLQYGKLTALSLKEAELAFELLVENPNPVGATLTAIAYVLYLNDEPFLSGTTTARTAIAASKSSTLHLPVTIDFKEAAAATRTLPDTLEAAYRLEVQADIDVPVLGTRSVNASRSGTLPIPRLPDIRLDRITLSNLSLSSAQVEVTLLLHNPGGVAYQLQTLDYALRLDEHTIATLESAPGQRLYAGESSQLTLTLHLDLKALGLGAYRQLSRSGIGIKLRGEALLRPLHPAMEEARRLPFETNGTL